MSITGYYVELQDTSDIVTKVNNNVIGETAEVYAASSSAEIVNGGEEFYPDLEWPASAAITSVEINGNPVQVHELVGGKHAPDRPR